jgi:hypothetical protein
MVEEDLGAIEVCWADLDAIEVYWEWCTSLRTYSTSLEGRFGSNGCKTCRFLLCLAWAVRQELQVANSLSDLFVGK